jgi:hypothetical protein
MNPSSDFQQQRKRAIVCAGFAAVLSAVAASTIASGHQLYGFVIIAIQALLIVLAVLNLVWMKGAGKATASKAT